MTSEYLDLYCKLYIDTDEDRYLVKTIVAEALFGNVERWNITNDVVNLNVMKNEDFDATQRRNPQEGHLYSRFYLEIEPQPEADPQAYVTTIGDLLRRLWREKFAAVAICDFAKQLPREGGLTP